MASREQKGLRSKENRTKRIFLKQNAINRNKRIVKLTQ